jgi:nitrogenase-stabilizing/protective protein
MRMNIVDRLARLSSAEDFFHELDVPYDPAVLNVARLHILRRMGEYMRDLPTECGEEESYELVRGHLLRAYLDFVHSTPMEQKVFKVHQQAGARPPALVSIHPASS